jgi:hypothetical protein
MGPGDRPRERTLEGARGARNKRLVAASSWPGLCLQSGGDAKDNRGPVRPRSLRHERHICSVFVSRPQGCPERWAPRAELPLTEP